MDKKRLIGWILFLSISMLWLVFNEKQQMGKMRERRTADSIHRVDSLIQAERVKKVDEVIAATEQAKVGVPTNLSSAVLGDSSKSVITTDSAHSVPVQKIVVQHPLFTVELSNAGAVITSFKSKEIQGHWGDSLPSWLPKNSNGFFQLQLDKNDESIRNWEVVEPVGKEVIELTQKTQIVFSTIDPTYGQLTRTYVFDPDSHGIEHKLTAQKWPSSLSLVWNGGLVETEKTPKGKGFGLTNTFFSEVVLASGPQSVVREKIKDEKIFNEQSGALRWVGLRRKYAAAIVNFGGETSFKVKATTIKESMKENELPSYSLVLTEDDPRTEDLQYTLQFMPLQYHNLLAYNEGYEKILFSGWESFFRADIWYVKLCGFVLKLLLWFHSVIPNWGIAIILLTLLVRFGLLPLTITQTRSMSQMQAHMPATKAIKERNKGNAQKANQELMQYYKEKGINPMSGMLGCLPMFLQFPVFIALFHVLGRAVELKGAGFFGWITDLSRPDVLFPQIAIPMIFPEGITILPIFMAITMFFQMKATITDPNQKPMIWMMPFMMFFFSASFPSGLVLYWTVSNIFTIAQTKMLKKPVMAPIPPVISGKKK